MALKVKNICLIKEYILFAFQEAMDITVYGSLTSTMAINIQYLQIKKNSRF